MQKKRVCGSTFRVRPLVQFLSQFLFLWMITAVSVLAVGAHGANSVATVNSCDSSFNRDPAFVDLGAQPEDRYPELLEKAIDLSPTLRAIIIWASRSSSRQVGRRQSAFFKFSEIIYNKYNSQASFGPKETQGLLDLQTFLSEIVSLRRADFYEELFLQTDSQIPARIGQLYRSVPFEDRNGSIDRALNNLADLLTGQPHGVLERVLNHFLTYGLLILPDRDLEAWWVIAQSIGQNHWIKLDATSIFHRRYPRAELDRIQSYTQGKQWFDQLDLFQQRVLLHVLFYYSHTKNGLEDGDHKILLTNTLNFIFEYEIPVVPRELEAEKNGTFVYANHPADLSDRTHGYIALNLMYLDPIRGTENPGNTFFHIVLETLTHEVFHGIHYVMYREAITSTGYHQSTAYFVEELQAKAAGYFARTRTWPTTQDLRDRVATLLFSKQLYPGLTQGYHSNPEEFYQTLLEWGYEVQFLKEQEDFTVVAIDPSQPFPVRLGRPGFPLNSYPKLSQSP